MKRHLADVIWLVHWIKHKSSVDNGLETGLPLAARHYSKSPVFTEAWNFIIYVINESQSLRISFGQLPTFELFQNEIEVVVGEGAWAGGCNNQGFVQCSPAITWAGCVTIVQSRVSERACIQSRVSDHLCPIHVRRVEADVRVVRGSSIYNSTTFDAHL